MSYSDKAFDNLLKIKRDLEFELLEQSRLLGKSGSREAALLSELESSRQEIERLKSLVDAKIKWCQDTKALYDHAKKELEAERQSTRELVVAVEEVLEHKYVWLDKLAVLFARHKAKEALSPEKT